MKKILEFLKKIFTFVHIIRVKQRAKLKAELKTEIKQELFDELTEHFDNLLSEAKNTLQNEVAYAFSEEIGKAVEQIDTEKQNMYADLKNSLIDEITALLKPEEKQEEKSVEEIKEEVKEEIKPKRTKKKTKTTNTILTGMFYE